MTPQPEAETKVPAQKFPGSRESERRGRRAFGNNVNGHNVVKLSTMPLPTGRSEAWAAGVMHEIRHEERPS